MNQENKYPTPFCNSPTKPHTIFDQEGKRAFKIVYDSYISFYSRTEDKNINEAATEMMDGYICPECSNKVRLVIKSVAIKKQSFRERLRKKFLGKQNSST